MSYQIKFDEEALDDFIKAKRHYKIVSDTICD